MRSEREASDHTGGSATRQLSNRETWGRTRHERRGHEPPGLGTQGGRTRGAEWWWQPPNWAERAPASPGGGARPAVRAVEAMDHPISPVGGGSIRSR